MGVYPAVTLAAARKRLEEARTQFDNGIDPADVQRAKKVAQNQAQENSFQAIALEWFEKERPKPRTANE